ncbi:hypothetical protein PAHAL_9G321500 [Panicum hallii]|uniref:Uncharacterized protein n=1 Tax=Panicum hallii TaxID=206008 RepID=A0A2T8I366_9POAL|nr:hypothetical protein PAHAL_9G321500 [Panicum hallii]
MRNSNGGLIHRHDWVQDGTLLVVFGDVVRVFRCKSKNGVSTNVLSKSNHTHGGGITEFNAQDNPRMRSWFIYGKLSYMQRFVLKYFQNKFSSTKENTMSFRTGSKF